MNELLRSDAPDDGALAAELAELERWPVNHELVARLAALPAHDSGAWCSPRLRVRVAALWTAVSSWASAEALQQVGAGSAEVDALDLPVEAVNFATDLGLQTAAGDRWADRQIELAHQLRTRLPVTAGALHDGVLVLEHARAMMRVLQNTDDATAGQVDERLIPQAAALRWTPGQLAAAARRLLLRLDPDGGAERHDRAMDRWADVTGGPGTEGLAWLTATGDAVTIGDILEAVDTRARQLMAALPDTAEGRARMAALGDLVLGADFTLFDHVTGSTRPADAPPDPATQPEPDVQSEPATQHGDQMPVRRSRRREVIVTVDLATLLGLRDDPANVVGLGPIPARIARLIAADASLRRMVTDPVTGAVVDLDRRARTATDLLATAIRAADQTCQFPGCTRAQRAEIDHRTDWAPGGRTEPRNLQLLCRRHHTLKTAGLWTCQPQPDGSVRWHGPDGQTAVRPPDRSPDRPPGLETAA